MTITTNRCRRRQKENTTTTKSAPSREQIIEIAWKKSNAYSKFKMGTISKTEIESGEKYNKWVKKKEGKAKRRWVESCTNGTGRDCWREPVIETENIVTNTTAVDEYESKQDQARDENINWLYNKNQGSSKPAHTGPIRKEKKNGVWKFSN